jgi:hypothetical protein
MPDETTHLFDVRATLAGAPVRYPSIPAVGRDAAGAERLLRDVLASRGYDDVRLVEITRTPSPDAAQE